MKTAIVYTITSKWGTEGLYTWAELVLYCRDWWYQIADKTGEVTIGPKPPDWYSDSEIVHIYFNLQEGETFDSFTITEEMLNE